MGRDVFLRNHLKGDFFDHLENVFRPDRLVQFVCAVIPHRVEDVWAEIPVLPLEFVQYRYNSERQGEEFEASAFLVYVERLLREVHVVPLQVCHLVPPES